VKPVKVKAQALLNAVRFLDEEYGQSTLRDIIQQCSPEVRERYVSAIAINWHPVEELVELVRVSARVLGKDETKMAELIGAAGARANMKGIFIRFTFWVANPEYLMKRIAALWRQFNDQGEMKVLQVADTRLVLEVAGIREPSWLFCSTITGWCREVSSAMGVSGASATHPECRSKGDARCVWDVRGHSGPAAPLSSKSLIKEGTKT
jgi:hypothetical protein